MGPTRRPNEQRGGHAAAAAGRGEVMVAVQFEDNDEVTVRFEARRGEARRGEARRGEARRGKARRGEARRGEAEAQAKPQAEFEAF